MKKQGDKAASDKAPSVAERLDAIGIDSLCNDIANGMSLNTWCGKHGFNYTSVTKWMDRDSTRSEKYARARDSRADLYFDQLDDLLDDAVAAESAVQVAGLRLKVDTIKWKLGKMSPKKYGDRVENVLTGGDTPVSIAVKFVKPDGN